MRVAAAKQAPLEGWRRALVEQYAGLSVYFAKQIYRGGYVPEDVIADGNVGLCIAAQRFEPERGYKFPTYARFWVRAMIFMGSTMRDRGVVRMGGAKDDRIVRFGLNKAYAAVTRQLGTAEGADDVALLAAQLGVSEDAVERANQRMRDTSIDLLTAAGFEHVLTSSLPGADELVEERDAAVKAAAVIQAAVATLDKRERRIVKERYLRESPRTLEALGEEMNLTRERVRQLEVRALKKLRFRLAEAQL